MLLPSPLQKLEIPVFSEKKIQVFVKRDDLIDPVISGNKWRKLKHNFAAAKKHKSSTILTFGGAYSNHIAATAYAGKLYGYKTIGIIRGEETHPLNPTLKKAKEDGMQLHYVSRSDYRLKTEAGFLQELQERFGMFYLVPEGGGNALGAKGCEEIVNEIDLNFDYIVTDCGTGTTLAGIVSVLEHQKAIGVPVLKGGEFIHDEVASLLGSKYPDVEDKYTLKLDYHFGGYAKHKPELLDFMRWFYQETGVKTDPVYTGKLFYAVMDLVKRDFFKQNSTVVVVHTGGLQGIEGFEERWNVKIF